MSEIDIMGNFILIKPSEEYIDEIRDYRQEFFDYGSNFAGDSGLRNAEKIKTWIEHCRLMENKETVPNPDWVEAEQYMLVKKGEHRILGMINFRHYLNDYLMKIGGHLGYEVRPSERGKGYAKTMLLLCLEKCREYDLDKALVTCDDDNEASKRTILACGGVFDGITKDGSKNVERYWITLIQETDEERQARIYPIILSEYNPSWSDWYAEEKVNLERLIGLESIARISHYGSTSVPGLTAKPTVDILFEIKENIDIEELIAALPSSKYICLRREGNSLLEHDEVMIIKGYLSDGFTEKVYHIHVRYSGDWDELYFRDYLIAHLEAAAEYSELKRSLFKDYEHNRDGYTEAKGAFIKEITKKAREEKGCAKE